MTKTHMRYWDVKIRPCQILRPLTEGIGDKIRSRRKYRTMAPYMFNLFRSCRTIRVSAENEWDVPDVVAGYLEFGEEVVYFKEINDTMAKEKTEAQIRKDMLKIREIMKEVENDPEVAQLAEEDQRKHGTLTLEELRRQFTI